MPRRRQLRGCVRDRVLTAARRLTALHKGDMWRPRLYSIAKAARTTEGYARRVLEAHSDEFDFNVGVRVGNRIGHLPQGQYVVKRVNEE